MRDVFKQFKNNVLKNFAEYQVPVIALGADTSHEAVCLVFALSPERCVAAYTFLWLSLSALRASTWPSWTFRPKSVQ